MEKAQLEAKLKEREEYFEKVKGELNAVAGQIVLLKELIASVDKKA